MKESNFFSQEPKLESRFSAKLLAQAREAARNMRMKGEDMVPLTLGEQSRAYWISTDAEQLIGSQKFEVDGTTFYLGMRKEV